LALSLGWLGNIALFQGQPEGERLVRESIAIYPEISRGTMASGFYVVSLALMSLGEFHKAHSLLDENVAGFQDPGTRNDVAHVFQACAKMHLGRYEQGRTQAEAGLAMAREADGPLNVGAAYIVLGWEALVREAYAQAQTLFRESVDIYQDAGQQDMLSWALAFLGYAERGLGQHDRAKKHLCRALQIAIEIQSFIAQMFTLPGVALLLADLGHEERAVELYALASRYPVVANSRWFADVVGQHIAAVAAALPPDIVAAAKERGRARDLDATMAECLIPA
jgi:tetratricopeptide (TPR) repeat protein